MSTEVEARAREMGWKPKEEFELDPARWVDAETYVKRGEDILPVLRANNRRLSEDVVSLRKQLSETQQAIQDLKDFNTDIAKNNAKVRERELLTSIKEAKTAGDVDTEVQLTEQLTDLKAEIKTAAAKPVVKPTPEQPVVTAEQKAWLAENPWFGNDKRKTGYAFGVAEELKSNGLVPGSAEFYKAMDKEIDKQFNQNSRREAASKVEGANGSGGASGGGDKSYADLPQDAKDACEKLAPKFVGKSFKDLAAWRAHYTTKYFTE